MHRARVAGKIDNKCAPDGWCDTFVLQQQSDVEEISRMLAVESGAEFTTVEVGICQCHYSSASTETALRGRLEFPEDGGPNAPAEDKIGFHFDLHAIGRNRELGDESLDVPFRDATPSDSVLNVSLDL